MERTKKKTLLRKAACIALTAAMGATFVAGNVVAFSGGAAPVSVQADTHSLNFENANGTVSLDAVKLQNLSKDVKENEQVNLNQVRSVIVTLKGDCLAKQTSNCSQFMATPAGIVAAERIEREQDEFLNSLTEAGISYTLVSRYDAALNAVALQVNLKNLATIKKIGGVQTVSVSSTYSLPKNTEGEAGAQIDPESIYANGIYNSEKYVAQGYDGRGMSVAILDTGIDYTHDAFLQDVATPKYDIDSVRELFANKTFHAEQIAGSTADDVYVSSKVPFAFDYADYDADVYPSYSQHGTHVAGIVGGKSTKNYTNKDGYDSGELFRGVAPEAQLIICKVFTDNLEDKDLGGAETIDILNALDDCVMLGVDVINMSLGTSSGFSTESLGLDAEDSEGLLMRTTYDSIREAGISLIVAASNEFSSGYGSAYGTNLASNPDSGTVGSPSTFSGAVSVASVNGQLAPYLLANGEDKIYFEESRNEDSDAYDFIQQMLGDKESETFKYVVIPGYGTGTDFNTRNVKKELEDKSQGKVIAVIQRGGTTFKKKLETAKDFKADAAIVYNNVSGMIRMSLGDMEDPIPSISVSMDAGLLLKKNGSVGTITIKRSNKAGPFMNNYSSWGTTPDLKLKPDVTSHGGEITSAVAGGYDEMSGTSMACPNLAGFTALFKSYLKNEKSGLFTDDISLTKLTNNIVMSTAKVLYDENGLPYSPRKQGAGLATLANVFSTNAYLSTKDTEDEEDKEYMCEDGRPKAELGEDKNKTGEYNITFYINNFGSKALKFKASTLFFTETLGADGKSVAEKANILTHSTASWKVGGVSKSEGETFEAPVGQTKVEVKLTLGEEDKKFIDKTFVNGMYVEGFLRLLSAEEGQCDLSFPFMGFYGDWSAAPLLDYDCYEIAAFEKDSSYNINNPRPEPFVWATQAYSYYYNEKYATPLGSFMYLQDENKEHTSEYVYTDVEHTVISRYNEYSGDDSTDNYLTVTGIKALYAGLLRNAELVTYTLTNADTGEVVPDKNGSTEPRLIYRVSKAMAQGGSPIPAQVLLELRTEDLGLPANGKYELNFKFYYRYSDYVEGKETDETFDMTFYIDYEAPVLVDTRIRYQDMKDSNGKETQKVYLDLDVFDNTYPQCVILCYSETGEADEASLKLATEYITPIINPLKNSTTTVSIDITNIYNDYKGKLFVELDDYALNHNVYIVELEHSQASVCPEDFYIKDGDVTIDKNTAQKLTVENLGNANVSNLGWSSSDEEVVKVKNGEIFGVKAGVATVTAYANGAVSKINVTVKESNVTLSRPTLSFGTIFNKDDAPVLATGTVQVNPAQQFKLTINTDPWYYPIEELGGFTWTTSDSSVATVEDGFVSVLFEGDKTKTVKITATAKNNPSCSVFVTLAVVPPYVISNNVLGRYRGWGGERQNVTLGDPEGEHYEFTNVRVLTIPNDKAITEIGEEAFKDNKNVEVVIIPKNVTKIDARAFKNCTSLKAIAFISPEIRRPADSSLTLIARNAFAGCTSLECADFSNCKVFTVDKTAFAGCESLKQVLKMPIIGTMYDGAFAGCTSLESVDLSSLHVAGASLFAGCTSLKEVITSSDTALGVEMFAGCTSLESIRNKVNASTVEEGIGCTNIPAGCFFRCTSLENVTLASGSAVGARAFAGCSNLKNINLTAASSFGDEAMRSCVRLNSASMQLSEGVAMGRDVFAFVNGAQFVSGGKIVVAAKTVTESPFNGTVTEVGDYAFSGSVLSGVSSFDLSGVTLGKGSFYGLEGLTSVTLPSGITEIPDYCFAGTGLTSIAIPSTVTKIGRGAFANCQSLATVSFGGATEIGNEAFANTALVSLTLPATVTRLGSQAFANCSLLEEVTLTNVNSMGDGAFAFCYNLTSATFENGCTTTGTNTFLTPDLDTMYSSGSLTSVTLGSGIQYIGEGTFAYCGALTQIDLTNVKVVGSQAFLGCDRLESATGLDKVKQIGSYAFSYCAKLTSLTLTAATKLDFNAFSFCEGLASVQFGSGLEYIGVNAFAATALTEVTIPASCEYVGTSAFGGALRLTAINVEKGNANYFNGVAGVDDDGNAISDGVLYRYISDTTYELCAYPAGRAATKNSEDGVATYAPLEGTVTIGEFSFNGVIAGKLTKLVLPYTVKLIGNGAFYDCGITAFVFNSIQAPALLEGIYDRIVVNDFSTNSLLNINFGQIATLVAHKPGGSAEAVSSLTISYPANGKGYDNFIYKNYFGTKVVLGELLEDDTRTLIDMLNGFMDSSEVASWAAGKTKQQVEAFAEEVKSAHVYYNALSKTQLEMVKKRAGEKLDNLFKIEQQLKSVKNSLGISVTISGIAVAADSAHKSLYLVGERFSMDGLKILITYSDLSQETVEASGNFRLQSRFDKELKTYDEAVMLDGLNQFSGMQLGINITVKEELDEPEPETPEEGEGGSSAPIGLIVGLTVGGAALAAAAAVAVIFFLKYKKSHKTAQQESTATEETEEQPDQTEEEAKEEKEEQPEEAKEEQPEQTEEIKDEEGKGND